MDSAAATVSAPLPGAFEDGLGKRRHVGDPAGSTTFEVLCLRDELTAVPAFEFALRERASRLTGFRHPSFGPVRSVDRLTVPGSGLAVVSEYVPGVRLSRLLGAPEHRRLDINAALHLTRQLVTAVAALHEHERDVAHGAIAPERLIITPNARLVIVEYVLGAALEQLHYSRERYWTELRLALPRAVGLPRIDQRADVVQIGVVALSLVLGRLLNDDEYPARIGDVVGSAWALSARGGLEPLSDGLRTWLSRALQLDARTAFANAREAADELTHVLEEEKALKPQAHDDIETTVRLERAQPVAVPKPEPAPKAPPAEPVEPPPLREAARVDAEVQKIDAPAIAPAVVEMTAQPWASAPAVREESYSEPEADGASRFGLAPSRLIAAAAALAIVAGGGVFGARRFFAPAAAMAATTGTVSITTNPSGAQVVIDGRTRGVSPLSIALNPGPHSMELRGPVGDPRIMSFNVTAGTSVSQFFDLPKAAALGQMEVRTEPAGAQVTVDDVPRGTSPLVVDRLTAGEHVVAVAGPAGSVKQHVTITPGTTAAVVVPLAPEAPASGWVSIKAPVEVQLYENKRLLGTSESDRIMVPAGRHEIEIVNDTLGYRATRTVQVAPGKVTPLKAEWPKGTMSLNATPWAEVWVDGEKVGETPIGNLSVPIGAHEVIFRHPELGEQRQAVSITVNAPARLSVDMRKK
jgi:hypothetical protein